MANFFLDNEDIRFLFDYYDLKELARAQELDTENGDADYVPVDEEDAIDNYRNIRLGCKTDELGILRQ